MATKAAIENWMSVDDVAGHLGINKDTVYKWLQRKKMPGHKVGRLWKFKLTEIDRWVISGHSATKSVQEAHQ